MIVDWRLVIDIALPIITVFLTVWADRRFERRPILMAYYGHVSAFRVAQSSGQPILVNTHSVIVRNAGLRSANNVRLSHYVLPDFAIWPAVQHHVEDVPGNGREIVIPILVPGEEITVSYLYFAPTTFTQINAGIRSDEGFARAIPVLLQRQFPRWVQRILAVLVYVGIVAIVYVAVRAVLFLLK